MGRERRQAWWAKWLLALASTVTVLGAGEVVLRRTSGADPTIPALFRVPHPVLGWALEPNAHYRNPFPDGAVEVRINSAGWRDRERAVQKPPGGSRIVILGDSFIEAYSVDLQDAIHGRMEAAIGSASVEVLGFAVAGYSTMQEYLAFREAAVRYSPDLVVLGVCLINDVRDNSRELASMLENVTVDHGARPFLERHAAAWRIDLPGVAAPGARGPYALRRFYSSSGLLRRLQLVGRTDELRRRSEKYPQLFDLSVNGVNYCQPRPEYDRAWDITAELLRRLRDEAHAAGAEFAVFTVPSRRESDPRLLRGADRLGGGRLCMRQAPANERLASILDGLGVPLIDLLPEFRRKLSEGRRLFRESDRHWNATGHALAADVVLAELERLRLTPQAELGWSTRTSTPIP